MNKLKSILFSVLAILIFMTYNRVPASANPKAISISSDRNVRSICHEGAVITEEYLQAVFADFIKMNNLVEYAGR